jgi:4a-hydroxytetrahydrobiopterin dehydratase
MKKSDDRTIARVVILNLLILPGLGSLRARRWFAGFAQITLVLLGAAIMFVWLFKELSQYYRLMFDDVKPQTVGWLGVLGGILGGISWLWAAVTSFDYYRANSSRASYLFENSSPPKLKSSESRIATALLALPDWRRNGETISRIFVFQDFPAAMKFVEAVGEAAERGQHHPDIDIRWNKVTLALTTHDSGGLTEKDFALARQCDALALR